MLVVKYSKTDGAQFISHLDTLRHLQKTIIRAKIPVGYSKGFNPHMLIFMSAPIGVGLKSSAEFFYLETDCEPNEFKDKFNEYCPGGFCALSAFSVSKNPNLQGIIDAAGYFIDCDADSGIVEKVLGEKEYTVINKKGVLRDVKDRILYLKNVDNGLIAGLSFGNETLRADVFAQSLASKYGVTVKDIIKKDCFIKGQLAEKYIKENFYV